MRTRLVDPVTPPRHNHTYTGTLPTVKIPAFKSEFAAGDVPTVTGNPLPNADLDQQGTQTPHWVRARRSQEIAVVDAVYGFYFAKRFSELLEAFEGWTNAVAEMAVEDIEARLWRLAVIDVAKVNDSNQLARAASLPGVLKVMKVQLDGDPAPVLDADRVSLQAIRDATNPEVVVPLKYVRHIRNKWAGHPSMDRDFDDWADADEWLSVPLIEEALAILIRAHQDAAELARRSPALRSSFAPPAPTGEDRTQPDGAIVKVHHATIAWSSVSALAHLHRDSAKRQAEALLDQLTSPPGYGSADDLDWTPDSTHATERARLDVVVERAVANLP